MGAEKMVLPQRAPGTQRKIQFLRALRALRAKLDSSLQRKTMHNRTRAADRNTPMTDAKKICRRYPIGAELVGDGRVHFRIWAPKARKLEVAIDGKFSELEPE